MGFVGIIVSSQLDYIKSTSMSAVRCVRIRSVRVCLNKKAGCYCRSEIRCPARRKGHDDIALAAVSGSLPSAIAAINDSWVEEVDSEACLG